MNTSLICTGGLWEHNTVPGAPAGSSSGPTAPPGRQSQLRIPFLSGVLLWNQCHYLNQNSPGGLSLYDGVQQRSVVDADPGRRLDDLDRDSWDAESLDG